MLPAVLDDSVDNTLIDGGAHTERYPDILGTLESL
jgi:hypothetical protein